MIIDATGRQNLSLTGDDFCSRADNNTDVVLNIGVPSFTNAGDTAVFYARIRFNDSPVVDNSCIGDHDVSDFCFRMLTLTHSIPNNFTAAEFNFIPIIGVVVFYFDNECGISEAQAIARRGAKHQCLG
jgi:hypothetical protein